MTCPPLPEADALAERFAAIALAAAGPVMEVYARGADRKSTRLNSSH